MSWTDIPVLSCVPHDGDTFTCQLDLGFDITFTVNVRLLGVNAPEVTGPEKEAGLAVLEVVRRWIAGKDLRVDSVGWDKFGGRVDGRVYGITGSRIIGMLGDYLFDNGLVKAFDGTTKKPSFTKAECAAIIEKCKTLTP